MQINVNAASERILGESDLQKCGCGENTAKMLMIMKESLMKGKDRESTIQPSDGVGGGLLKANRSKQKCFFDGPKANNRPTQWIGKCRIRGGGRNAY